MACRCGSEETDNLPGKGVLVVHIVIVGGGGIGYTLAKLLSDEEQDVIIIEKDPDKARQLNEEIDAMVHHGSGASAVALEEAGIHNAEMLIAVTEVDEVNMIACMLAKKYQVPITVARVRNPEYYEGSSVLTNEQLGIDIFINPERVASFEISKLIRTPNVRETEFFAKGQIQMIGVVVDGSSKMVNQPLRKITMPRDSIVAAIERKNGEFLVPDGSAVIYPEDKIFMVGRRGMLSEVSWLIQKKESRALNVVILGGGRIGLQVAEMLELSKKNQVSVKIIEKSEECCNQIAGRLKKTLILHGDATDLSFLRQEEIQDTDVLVAATGDDRTNILSSILARQFGVKRTICEVINMEYFSLFQDVGIEHVISPRLLTAAQILRLIRKGDILSMSLLEDGKMEVMELKLDSSARVAHKKVQNAGIPKGILVGAILRDDEVILPGGGDYLLPGDRLIIFASPKLNHHIDRLFAGELASIQDKKRSFKESTNGNSGAEEGLIF